MRKRLISIIVSACVLGVAFVVWTQFGGCGPPKTRVAERKVNLAPDAKPSAAEDWPKWRGPRGDGISRETDIADSWPPGGPPLVWAADVGVGYSSPIAAQGRVYLFTLNGRKETLTAFDANSGKIIWNEASSGPVWDASYFGTRATPAIDGDAIYTYGGGAELTCRDLASGKSRWRVNILQQTGAKNLGWGTASSPLIANGLVYVQSGSGGAIAVAVRKDDGSVAWKSEARGVGGYAHPVLIEVEDRPQLVIFAGEAVYAMDPASGKTIWSHSWRTSYDVNASTPVYRDGHLFVSSGYGHGCQMLRLSADGARKLWESKAIQSKFQGVILDGNALYGNSEGTLTCLSWPDGALLWDTKKLDLPLGAGGSLVRLGERLLLMSERGKLSLARATPEGVKPLAKADLIDGREVWSTPLIYGGRLYAKGTSELLCFDLTAPGSRME